MLKIANTAELQSELRRLLRYAASPLPSRAVLANDLRDLSRRVAKGGDVGKDLYDGPALPKDLSELTSAQSKKVVDFLAEKPLKELRKRQDLVNKQIQQAHSQKNDEALANLQAMQKYLDSAVDQSAFDD